LRSGIGGKIFGQIEVTAQPFLWNSSLSNKTTLIMKSAKVLGLTLFLFIGFIVPSCDKSEDDDFGCDCSQYKHFDIQGFRDFSYTRDSFFQEEILPFDTVSFAEFKGGAIIRYLVDYHAFAEPKHKRSFSLISTANACSCIGGYAGSKTEKIKDFTITTINDFDNEHPAGSSINDLLITGDFQGNFLPFDEFLNNQTGFIMQEWRILKLKKPPVLNPEFNFKIRLELSTGEIYEKAGFPIYILP